MSLFEQNWFIVTINVLLGFGTPIFALLVVEWLLPVRKKWWAKPLLYVGCCLLVGMVIFVGDPVNLPGALLPFGLAVFLCCEGTRLQRLSITLILASFGLSFNALVDSMYIPFFALTDLLRFLIWCCVYLALRRFAPKQEYNLSTRLWVLVDVLTLTPFAATLITVLLGDINGGMNIQDVFLLPVVTLSSFGLLWSMVVFARQQKLEQEKNFFEFNQMYYQNLEHQQFQVRRLRHDMANHLQAMSALKEPELREYLGQLIKSPAMECSQRFCENTVVNAVLAAKQQLMEQKEITAEFSVALLADLSVEAVDLCAIFANSLDNAIEACEELSADQRRIIVKARADKGLFVLQVQNPIKEKTIERNDLFASTKQNAKAHGFGLTSIREIAGRYNGFVNITTDNGHFTLLTYLSLSQ